MNNKGGGKTFRFTILLFLGEAVRKAMNRPHLVLHIVGITKSMISLSDVEREFYKSIKIFNCTEIVQKFGVTNRK